MAALSTIVLQDAQTTPVSHSFVPSRQWLDPTTKFSMWEFLDLSVNSGVPQLANRILIGTKTTNRGGKFASDWQKTVTATLMTPIGEALGSSSITGIDPQPQKAFDLPFYAKFIRPGRSSEAQAKDIRKYAYQLLAVAQLVDAFEGLKDPGSV